MVVVNYLTMISVIIVICYINCDFVLLFRTLINNERRWLIVINYHAFHLPDGATFFAHLMYADYIVMLRIKWPCFLPKTVKIRAALLKLLAEMCGPV